ncbi:MAG: hypothetical protein LBH43_15265 [Treponema sp.]|nr:hypothetical protein [Treponema sp.]
MYINMFKIRYTAFFAVSIVIFLLFCSCGEMNSIFPVSRTYQVSALTEDVSLDEAVLIRKKDKIRPFFTHSVKGDTDLQGLRILLQDIDGGQVGEAVLYYIKDEESELYSEEGGLEQAQEQEELQEQEQEEVIEEEEEEDEEENSYEDFYDDPYAEESIEEETQVYSVSWPVRRRRASYEALGPEQLEEELELLDEEFFEEEFEEVFEEKLPDLAVVDPEPVPKKERLISVKRMDEELPAFTLPETLEAGAYIMIFQVLGKGQNIITTTEKPFYYMAGKNYNISEIKASLPGLSSTPHLFQPETTVLLEAQVEADKGLNPYIVWYNGKKRIHSGTLLAGAGRFLWKIPNSVSFINLRAEVIPFPPVRSMDSPGLSGIKQVRDKIKTLSLAVSAKGQIMEVLAPLLKTDEAGDSVRESRYYCFEGNLLDSLNYIKEQALLPIYYEGSNKNRGKPFWISSGYTYGLAVGPQDRYIIPEFPLKIAEKTEVILNFMPLSPGVFFTVLLSEIRMELFWDGENIRLDFFDEDQEKQTLVSIPGEKSFFTLPLFFSMSEEDIKVVMGGKEIILELDNEDEGSFQLGGGTVYRADQSRQADSEQDILAASPQPVMILNEMVLIRRPDMSREAVPRPSSPKKPGTDLSL